MTSNVFVVSMRNTWFVASAIAAIGSLPVAIYGDSAPWLIAIPITVGAVVLAAIKFATEKEEFWKLVAEDEELMERHSESKGSSDIFANVDVSVNKTNWPVEPDGFIDPNPSFEEKITSIIARQHRLVLTGQQGTGKTTCAIRLCRKYEKLNGHSPIKRAPVFISLSQTKRMNGLSSMFLEQISEQLVISHLKDDSANAKKMMKDGLVFLVLDDLDYMTEKDEDELQKFISHWGKNAFMCIISEVPPNSFLSHHFIKIEMPEWEPSTVKSYIDRRIEDSDKKTRFLASLEQGHILQQPMPPYQASFLVDACLDGTFFQLLSLGELKSDMDYKILDDYLCIMLASSDRVRYRGIIHSFGKLAMKLLKDGRSNFIPEKEEFGKDQPFDLTPKLFQQNGENVAFSQSNYQIFLAGRYIAEFWPEASTALQDAGARVLIWKPVYSCARQFIPPSQKKELDETFHRLAKY